MIISYVGTNQTMEEIVVGGAIDSVHGSVYHIIGIAELYPSEVRAERKILQEASDLLSELLAKMD